MQSSGIAAGFELGSALVVVGGAAIAGWRIAIRVWGYTFGRRRAQQRLVNMLACGSSRRFIDDLLGVPQFVQVVNDREYNVYRLTGSWISVTFVRDVVVAFAVTVTNSRLWVSTSALTFGLLTAKLGRTPIQTIPAEPKEELAWIGARRVGHVRRYYFGNPGGYETFWLSFNDAGDGDLVASSNGDPVPGQYGDSPPPHRSTANTLTVVADQNEADRVRASWQFGVDLDTIRLRVGG